MAIAALKQISEWGINNIGNSLSHFTDEIASRALELGLTVPNKKERAPHILGIQFQNGVPDRLAKNLQRGNIYVSIRGNSIRIAPYLYNTNKDVDRLFTVIKQSL
jgi:selenocysteine lyase/cysteine desulfurase